MSKKINDFLKTYINQLTHSILSSNIKNIHKASLSIIKASKKRKNILVCGNGGSTAIANHYVCDYLKFLRENSLLRPKVISLSNSAETITAIGNDISFDQIFRYQAESIAEKGDLLIVISSSGKSKKIKEVMKFAKKKNYK